jgi:hypothetical protein
MSSTDRFMLDLELELERWSRVPGQLGESVRETLHRLRRRLFWRGVANEATQRTENRNRCSRCERDCRNRRECGINRYFRSWRTWNRRRGVFAGMPGHPEASWDTVRRNLSFELQASSERPNVEHYNGHSEPGPSRSDDRQGERVNRQDEPSEESREEIGDQVCGICWEEGHNMDRCTFNLLRDYVANQLTREQLQGLRNYVTTGMAEWFVEVGIPHPWHPEVPLRGQQPREQ